MICWYCHWGWPKPVADIYKKALDDLAGDDSALQYGPSHIVWSDENWDDESIDWCIDHCVNIKPMHQHFDPDNIAVVKESLEALKNIPVDVRCCEPKDYDGDHPENFPPPAGFEMERM